MHILPQLRKLERRHPNDLVIIGVHSAKFLTEKETPSVRKAVLRHSIDHPVVNDRTFRMWNEYTVQAWPTLMFIDPDGKVIGKLSGEFPLESVDQVITQMLAEFDAEGKQVGDLVVDLRRVTDDQADVEEERRDRADRLRRVEAAVGPPMRLFVPAT